MSAVTRRAVAARLLAPVLLLALLLPASAPADGDPASDILLAQSVFYPYTPAVTGAVQARLNSETAAAKRAGFPIKVALIASPTDLGVLPSLFGKPRTYASFLDKEISYHGPQPLLVVMAAGYGVAGMKAATANAVTPLSKPAGATSTDLAQSAVTAVSALASAAGHPLTAAATSTAGAGRRTSSGGGGSTGLLIGLIAAAIVVAGALIAVRTRRTPAR
jgi:hypothetical protein